MGSPPPSIYLAFLTASLRAREALKTGHFGGGNLYLLLRLGIDARAGFLLNNLECPQLSNTNLAVFLLERVVDRTDQALRAPPAAFLVMPASSAIRLTSSDFVMTYLPKKIKSFRYLKLLSNDCKMLSILRRIVKRNQQES